MKRNQEYLNAPYCYVLIPKNLPDDIKNELYRNIIVFDTESDADYVANLQKCDFVAAKYMTDWTFPYDIEYFPPKIHTIIRVYYSDKTHKYEVSSESNYKELISNLNIVDIDADYKMILKDIESYKSEAKVQEYTFSFYGFSYDDTKSIEKNIPDYSSISYRIFDFVDWLNKPLEMLYEYKKEYENHAENLNNMREKLNQSNLKLENYLMMDDTDEEDIDPSILPADLNYYLDHQEEIRERFLHKINKYKVLDEI